MMKYLSKFVLDILPSIVATVIGAYIVNHYIIAKPATPAPAAMASTVSPSAVASEARPAVASVETPAPSGARDAAQKPASAKLVGEKVAEKPAGEKPAVAPVVRHDANDLARAAIERLRGSNTASPSAEPVARAREAHRAGAVSEVTVQPVSMPVIQPLPPAIAIAPPAAELLPRAGDSGSQSVASTSTVRAGEKMDSDRLIPPADIPSASGMFGLTAGGASTAAASQTTVADDVVAAAKSMFQAVLPR